MKRRDFLSKAIGVLLVLPTAVVAQSTTKIPRIGFMRGERPPQAYLDAFEQGLRTQGYVPGKDILIDYRFPDGRAAELPRVAEELVRQKVDLIVAGGAIATRAARNATNTIPIVMATATDPVGNGFVASLAHPGGNITGTTVFTWDLFGKRVELLREVIPKLSRVAVLINRNSPAPPLAWQESAAAATLIGISLDRVEVNSANDFDEAFETMLKKRVEALIVIQTTLFDTAPYRVVQLAAKHRIPAIYGLRIQVEAGGLMSYGPSVGDMYGQAAGYVAKILKGAKPGDLPIEQPTRVELLINLKTAKELGLEMPQSLLLRADQVLR